jgi:hypothetical protein
MTADGIGEPLCRREDRRFLTGGGCYARHRATAAATCSLPALAPCPCGSPRDRHGRYAGEPWRRGDLHRRRRHRRQTQRRAVRLGHRGKGRRADEGTAAPFGLPWGKVRHVGDPVAVVIADSVEAAQSAAEHIAVEYRILPAVTEAVVAMAPGAPQLYNDVPRQSLLRLGGRRPTPPSPRPITLPRSISSTTGWCPTQWNRGLPAEYMARNRRLYALHLDPASAYRAGADRGA